MCLPAGLTFISSSEDFPYPVAVEIGLRGQGRGDWDGALGAAGGGTEQLGRKPTGREGVPGPGGQL